MDVHVDEGGHQPLAQSVDPYRGVRYLDRGCIADGDDALSFDQYGGIGDHLVASHGEDGHLLDGDRRTTPRLDGRARVRSRKVKRSKEQRQCSELSPVHAGPFGVV